MCAQPSRKCTVVTFYSYKGGTGRSMLLANAAWILASNGCRVLTIDWDLEAPGLHRYFQPFLKDKSLAATDGLIDAITEFVEAAVFQDLNSSEQPQAPTPSEHVAQPGTRESPAAENPDWYKGYANLLRYAVPLEYKFPGNGQIDLIGPGRQGPAYAAKVNLFDWEQFYMRFAGSAFLDAAKTFMRQEYDYVLIDSRTGVSDTSGICTMQMPDTLVVCFTLNNQSIEGARAVALAAQDYRKRSALGPLTIVPVPSRVEQFESERVELGRELARVRFRQLVPIAENQQNQERAVQQYWGNVEVPYVPKYAYEEVLACFADTPHLKSTVLSSAEQIASLIQGKATELVPPSDQERANILQQFARKPYIVTTAEEFVSGLSRSDQEAARRLFTRMVQPSSTKRSSTPDVPWMASLGDIPEDALALLEKATDAKLVVLTGQNANPGIMIADNRLLSAWPRFAAWIDQDREFLIWRQQFSQLFHTWEASKGDPDDLLTGTNLAEASKWVAERRPELNQRELRFIEASQKADEQVRQDAEASENLPLARRLQKARWEDKQQLEKQASELDSVRSAYSKRLKLTLVGTALLALAFVLYLIYRPSNAPPWSHQSPTPTPAASPSPQVTVDQRMRDEARRQEANILVSLGVVDNYDAASKLDPLEGILGIDRLITDTKKTAPKNLSAIQAARIQYLRNSEPLFDSSQGLRKYICEHNSFVIVASEKADHAAAGLKYWRKQFPLAEIGPASAGNPDWLPVIIDFFLTCSEARKEASTVHGSTPSQSWYNLPECTSCGQLGD